jgi:hypothetical protein
MALTNQPESDRKRKRAFLWNILTILVLMAIACLVFYFVTVFRDPRSWMNPFKPEPSPTVYYTLTSTSTIIQQPATWTPSITIKPDATRTHAPTWTPLAGQVSKTHTLMPSETFTPSITPTSMPASAEITYHPSTEIYPAKNCNWLGVGGMVIGTDGNPLQVQTIQLGGSLNEVIISQLRLSGSAPAYGASGFEFELGTQPVASTQTLWIQLFDNTGTALTEKIYFDTFDDCAQNLVKVTFTRNR